MQRLMYIAEEMQHEPHALPALPEWQVNVGDAVCVVRERGDDASFGEAVPGQVYAAAVGWVVAGVDVVPWSSVGEGGDIADAVGEEGCCCWVLGVE